MYSVRAVLFSFERSNTVNRHATHYTYRTRTWPKHKTIQICLAHAYLACSPHISITYSHFSRSNWIFIFSARRTVLSLVRARSLASKWNRSMKMISHSHMKCMFLCIDRFVFCLVYARSVFTSMNSMWHGHTRSLLSHWPSWSRRRIRHIFAWLSQSKLQMPAINERDDERQQRKIE